MSVRLTKDRDLIKSVFLALHDEIASDDYPHPDEVDFDYLISRDVFVAIEHDDGSTGGVVYFHLIGPKVWQGHIQMLPHSRGQAADAGVEEAIALLARTKPTKRIVAQIPSLFKNVAAFAKRHAFRRTDVLDELYMKNGKEYPIFVYEREVA